MYVKLCVCVCVCVRERERERDRQRVSTHFSLCFFFFCCKYLLHILMPDDRVEDSHIKHCHDKAFHPEPNCFLVLVLFKPTMENALHLNLSGEASVLYMGAPYPGPALAIGRAGDCLGPRAYAPTPVIKASKCATNTTGKKKLISWNVFSLSLSLSHTHTSSVILLCVYSMYIKHCCSVAMFGAKLYFLYFFKYVSKFILFGWICLSFIRFTNCYNISSTFLSGSQS